jgi:putative membrane protein
MRAARQYAERRSRKSDVQRTRSPALRTEHEVIDKQLGEELEMNAATVATVFADRGPWDGPGPWWPVFPVLWLVLIAAAVTFFVINGRRRERRSAQVSGASRLAERYASGDIDEDEYRHRLSVIDEKKS